MKTSDLLTFLVAFHSQNNLVLYTVDVVLYNHFCSSQFSQQFYQLKVYNVHCTSGICIPLSSKVVDVVIFKSWPMVCLKSC